MAFLVPQRSPNPKFIAQDGGPLLSILRSKSTETSAQGHLSVLRSPGFHTKLLQPSFASSLRRPDEEHDYIEENKTGQYGMSSEQMERRRERFGPEVFLKMVKDSGRVSGFSKLRKQQSYQELGHRSQPSNSNSVTKKGYSKSRNGTSAYPVSTRSLINPSRVFNMQGKAP